MLNFNSTLKWAKKEQNQQHKNLNHVMCKNCGKAGHLFSSCKLPIISYGIICFTHNKNNELEYLMINKKNSFGFIDFVKGKYSLSNDWQLMSIIDQMTCEEKTWLQTCTFQELYKKLWGMQSVVPNTNNYKQSQRKFETITKPHMNELVQKSQTKYATTEWEFPKGRKNINEKDLECALREFSEETGFSQQKLTLISNILPFEEIYVGTNYKMYKHKYYVGYIPKHISENLSMTDFQQDEVSDLQWMTYEKALNYIRKDFSDKKHMLQTVHNFLTENIHMFQV